jgi:peptidyl-prolyl cis-trans isomerase A (cyclophilin A)
VLSTNQGEITIELNQAKAPVSVKNFLDYADAGFYTNTILHRVIPGFMIQGGGFTLKMQKKPTKAPIKNEAQNGLSNKRGTIAMARTSVVDSATSQFFINLSDNTFLDHGVRDFGYAVFGKVISGMDIVDKIGRVKTARAAGHSNVPVDPVIIKSVTRK